VPAFDPEEASFASCREDKRPGDYSPRIAERLHNARRVVRAARAARRMAESKRPPRGTPS
jgi:hypothetical protein